MLFLLTLLLVACLLQFSARVSLPAFCQSFRRKYAELLRGLELTRWMKPVTSYRGRVCRHFRALLCPSWEKHSPPIIVLDSPATLWLGVQKVRPKELKIDLSSLRCKDWGLQNE